MRVLTASRDEKTVIVESLFRETTRNGKHTLRLINLAMSRGTLIITSTHSFGFSTPKSSEDNNNILEIRTLHSLDSITITIFKKSLRHALKLDFPNNTTRYFEMEKSCGSDSIWAKWCKYILQLSYKKTRIQRLGSPMTKSTSYDLGVVNAKWESQKILWNDKYLYLGSKREIEDSSRPVPVPGLGPAEDMKLLYLKPQYFGCWDQSEHWVQCESSKLLK